MRNLFFTFLGLFCSVLLYGQESVQFSHGADLSVNHGDTIEIPFIANGLSAINSLQFTMHWDPHMLKFLELSHIDTSFGLQATNIGFEEADEGKGYFVFILPDPSGFTVADGDTLMTLSYVVEGEPGHQTRFAIENFPLERQAFGQGNFINFPVSELRIDINNPNFPSAKIGACAQSDSTYEVQAKFFGNGFPATWTIINLENGSTVYEETLAGVSARNVILPIGNYVSQFQSSAQLALVDTLRLIASQPIDVSISTIGGTCPQIADGSIFIDSVRGGQAPYTYLWPDLSLHYNFLNDVRPEVYPIVVKDHLGCQDTTFLELEGPEIIVREDVRIPSCPGVFDGRVDANILNLARFPDSTLLFSLNGTNFYRDVNLKSFSVGGGLFRYFVQDTTGCIYEQEIDIRNENEIILQNEGVQDPLCPNSEDGLIQLSAALSTDFEGEFQFTWVDSIGNVMESDSFFQVTELPSGVYDLEIRHTGLQNGCVLRKEYVLEPADSLAFEVDSIRAEVCLNDGSGAVDLSPLSQTPVSIRWEIGDTTFNLRNLRSGVYPFTLTNANGCTLRDSIRIEAGIANQINIVSVDSVNCPEGMDGTIQLQLSSSADSNTYNYLVEGLNNSFEPISGDTLILDSLAARNYRVRFRDRFGCNVDTLVSIPEKPIFRVELLDAQEATCNVNDGVLIVRALPLTGDYDYNWSNNSNGDTLSNVGSGVYTLITRNGFGCERTDTFLLDNVGAPMISLDTVLNVLCPQSNTGRIVIQVDAGAAPIDSILWSNGDQGRILDSIGGGSYTVQVMDTNGCTVLRNYTIQEPDSFTIQFLDIVGSAPNQANGSVLAEVTGGTSPYTFVWNSSPIQTKPRATNLAPGNYELLIVDDNNCNYSSVVEIPIISTVFESEVTRLVVFPNPTQDFIRWPDRTLLNGIDYARIYQMDGMEVLDIKNPKHSINVSMLSSGMYLVRFYRAGRVIYVSSFMVSK